MGMAWPPAVDVAPAACRKPPIMANPDSKPQNKMSLDVIAPQDACQYPTADHLDPRPSPYATSASVATSSAQSQPASLSHPFNLELAAPQSCSNSSSSIPGPTDNSSVSAAEAIPSNTEPVSPPPPPSHSSVDDRGAPDNDSGSRGNPNQTIEEPSSAPSFPLSTVASLAEDSAILDTPPSQKPCNSPITKTDVQQGQADSDDFPIDYDHDGPEGHRILRLKPTVSQWKDFPAVLSFARRLGAENDGCFKVIIPSDMLEPLPQRSSQKAPANAYQIRQIKRNGYWRVSAVPSEGLFNCSEPTSESLQPVNIEVQKLKKLFNKNKDKQIRSVRYRVDIPAWTAKQRMLAGVPERSPIHPLKGDKLDFTKAIIPGIHTPYVYESAAFFGATFQIHAEDYRLASLNHLYKGRKIWIVVPSTAVDMAEEALGRKKKCSQFMRHRAEFFFPDKLDKLSVPYRVVDQRPGETIVILPDAYHEGFSTGYTIAEAKNYAESDWSTSTYQACDEKCQLLTAIPAAYMKLLDDGEERLDLCARYGDDDVTHMPKRLHDDTGQASDSDRDVKRAKV